MPEITFRILQEHLEVIDELRNKYRLDRKALFTLLVVLESKIPRNDLVFLCYKNNNEKEIRLDISKNVLREFNILSSRYNIPKVQYYLNLIYNYRTYDIFKKS